MKNIKTLGIIAMVAIITFAMIACGGGGGPSGDPDPDPGQIDLEDSILITFNSNDATFKTATQTAKKGQSVTLNANTWTRTGYIFLGWASSADANTAGWADKQTITAGQTDMNLFAVWLKIPEPFTTIADFKAYLDDLPANTAETAVPVKVNISDLGGMSSDAGSLGNALYTNSTKYVSLDLSGSSFTTIGIYAFSECKLTSVTIPAGVTSIGSSAFNSQSMKSVTFQGADTVLVNMSFDINGSSLKTAYEEGGAGTYTHTPPYGDWSKQ